MRTIEIEYALVDKYVLSSKLVATGITKNCGIVSHECDVLVINKNNFAIEFEIKTSLSDLKADLKKKHRHKCNKIKATYFVIPQDLLPKALEFIPREFGVMVVSRCSYLLGGNREKTALFEKSYIINLIRRAKQNKEVEVITSEELLELHRLENMRKKRYLKQLLYKDGYMYQYEKDKW